MNQIVYRPGDWQVVVEETGVIAVPADAATERIAQLSRMLQEGAPALTRVIDVLSGGSITDLGSFAVALTGPDGIRFAVRGAVDVRLAGGEPFSGADVTTWSERYVADARGFEIALDGSATDAQYPIRSGVVLAGAIRFGELGAQAPAEVDVQPEDEQPADELAVQQTLIPSDLTLAPEPTEDAAQPPSAAVTDATVVPAPAPPVATPSVLPPATGMGDHDGATISLAEARRLRAERGAAADAPTEVLTAVDEPATASTGRIHLSTGQVIELDRTVIIGRRPRSTRASGSTMPHLVALESPQQDISRSHLEIRPESDSVVVIDLHTTNGSTLLRPGADPVRLHPGEQTLVLDGDTVDLGDGVTVRFEGLT